MKFSEVKRLFLIEFGKYALSGYELRNTWFEFTRELFEAGSINARVYARCCEM